MLLTHSSKQNLRSCANEKISALVLAGLFNNAPYVYLSFFQKNFALCLSNVIEAAEAATKRKIMKILGLKLSQTAIFKIFPVSTETHRSKNISTRAEV